jgi:DNA-directed RNA polymerase subunit RPC12/RpoP
MPIRFRCTTCNRLLSTARRKAGKRVVCPQCEGEIIVPDADLADAGTAEVERESAEPANVAVTQGARLTRIHTTPRSTAVAAKPGDSGPLFERPDFERLLETAVNKTDEVAPTPKPTSPPQTLLFTPDEEGITISRGAAVVLVVLMVVLLALAFGTGYLIGS